MKRKSFKIESIWILLDTVLVTATVYVDCTKIYVEDELRYSSNV